jgi:8-oxo-dGTP pyrophosphatase MutT (NUDIX family)
MSYLSRLIDSGRIFSGPHGVRQVGGLCFRANDNGEAEVLLITTRETKRWTIPKGWPIKGLDPHQSAKQEAWEEAGVKGKVIRKPFGNYTYPKVLSSGDTVLATVQVHLLETRETRSIFPERGQRQLVWLPALEASSLVKEPELRKLLAKFSRRTAFK